MRQVAPGVRRAVTVATALFVAVALGVPGAGADPADRDCDDVRAGNFASAVGSADPDAVLRGHAIQMKQEVRHVETYEAYADKVACLFDDLVRPHLADDVPDLVVYPEYAGLATLGVGSRGAPAREIAEGPTRGDPATWQDAPGAIQAFGTLAVTYGDVLTYYRTVLATRQAEEDPEAAPDPERSFALADARRMILVATTDTVARAYLEPYSRLAREEGVFVVSSTALPELTRSDDPADVAAIADPDLDDVTEVWVAADARVWNEVHVWSPEPEQTDWSRERFGELDADDPRSNLIHINRKTPTTPIEEDFLALTEGDMSPANTGPFAIPGVDGLRFSIANSLPAFMWGEADPDSPAGFGEPVPEDEDPCQSGEWWMRCLDERGTNVVIQTEANPGPWADYTAPGDRWQPLTWMNSSWRHTADPTVGFRYTITPWLVGNLVDIPFDGQANIKRRDNTDPFAVRRFVGNRALVPDEDPEELEMFAGDKDAFVVTAPWVVDEDPSSDVGEDRERLRERAQAMLAGTDHEHENDYLETGVWADLTPPEPTPDPPAEPDPESDPTLPATGGGAVVAIVALIATAMARQRRRPEAGGTDPGRV